MKVVVAPDSFGELLTPAAAAAAIQLGWRRVRPDDGITLCPLADGGPGLLEVLAGPDDQWMTTEVAGPLGHPVEAAWLRRSDGTAVIESARACGLHLVPVQQRSPLAATSYGVGQLLVAARQDGARRILLGLGGTATVDGGAGALLALGHRVVVDDGSGLKVGGGQLHRVTGITRDWVEEQGGLELTLLADVATPLTAAAALFAPQKGAGPQDVRLLEDGLRVWADVAERDLAHGHRHRQTPGSGAAGGLGFGLACALEARFEPGARYVAGIRGLEGLLAGADAVVTGEGRLDATSAQGKVVAEVLEAADRVGLPVFGVVGQLDDGAPRLSDVEPSSPRGPGDDPGDEVAAAAARLAARR